MDEFGALFEGFGDIAFRLETINHYEIPEEHDDFAAFLAGDPLPPTPGVLEWIELLKTAQQRGAKYQRVRVLPSRLTPYLKFELDWGFLYHEPAGEDIRLIQTDMPEALFVDIPYHDFWLFDDEVVAHQVFDDQGRFVKAELIKDPETVSLYRSVRQIALRNAISLRQYLATLRAE